MYAPNVCAHSHDHTWHISTYFHHTHMHTWHAHTFTRLLVTHSNPYGESYQMYHTTIHQRVWLMVFSFPLEEQKTRVDQRRPPPSMVSIVEIRSGSMLETCHLHVPLWTHCCQEEGCLWWMVILNRCGRWLWKVTELCYIEIELIILFSGLAKLFLITPSSNDVDKSGKEADER